MAPRITTPFLLRDKLTMSCAIVLVLASVVSTSLIMGYLTRESRTSLERQYRIQAEQTARKMSEPVRLGRADEAGKLLDSFRDHPEIDNVEVLDHGGGTIAARYFRNLGPKGNQAEAKTERLHISVPVFVEDRSAGNVVFTVSLRQLRSSAVQTAAFLFGVNLFCLFVAIVGIYLMLSKVSEPIGELVWATKEVREKCDYSVRAKKFKDDEIGQLADGFNRMLATIETQSNEISEQAGRLARAEKMESLGLLAGGVAHDLNNLLGPMVAMPSLICDQLSVEDPMREDLCLIGDSAKRAATVVQDLLSLARRGNYTRRSMWLNSLVKSCLGSPAFRERLNGETKVQLSVELADELPPVSGSEPHLMQAVLNILINGVESMKGRGGTLKVRTGVEDLGQVSRRDAGLERLIDGGEGERVVLTISDDGCGIPKGRLHRILEPFFSSKSMGAATGSGLGLAVVYGVLEDHQAGLSVRSEPDNGTTFYLSFSACSEMPGAEKKFVPQQGSEKILVVDDVEAQRVLTERLLKSEGYLTATESNGRAAIDRLAVEEFDAVVLDMIMEEGFDGLDTYREIKRVQPGVCCVLATGYSDSERVGEVLSLGASACLGKPFSRIELSQAVRTALDDPRKSVALSS